MASIRMGNLSEARVAFSNHLRSYQSGAIGDDELLNKVDALLSEGVLPSVLLGVLERREYVEPLPEPIREVILSRLRHTPVTLAVVGATPDICQSHLHDATVQVAVAEPASHSAFLDDITTPVESPEGQSSEVSEISGDVGSNARASKRGRIGLAGGIAGIFVGIFISWMVFRPHPAIVSHESRPSPAKTLVTPRSTIKKLDAAPVGTVIWDCPDCPEMKVLPAGVYEQGSAMADNTAPASERPQHVVNIAHRFALSINDVTVGQYRAFATATGRRPAGCDIYRAAWGYDRRASWERPGYQQDRSYPVTCVSWEDASDYTSWISRLSGHRYRLPTAAEWEYAARAGGAAVQPWGADAKDACLHANVADQSAARRYPGWDTFVCDDGYVASAPVGSFAANAFGLHDMLGNVLQWTADCWRSSYSDAAADGSALDGPDCSERELRGSSWFTSPRYVRASARNHFDANYRTSSVGFRVARDLAQ